ncbi:MAG: hypothetical protein ACTHMT_04245 [Verrucomicrobiota bacterium]
MLASLVSGTCMGGGKYLAHIGPGPLRFEQAALRLNPAAVLPPLNMGTATATNQLSMNIELTNSTPEIVTAPNPVAPAETHIEVVPQNGSQQSPILAPDAEITPQLLLRYFNTNSNTETFIVPRVIFTPPAPPQSGSSATYISK